MHGREPVSASMLTKRFPIPYWISTADSMYPAKWNAHYCRRCDTMQTQGIIDCSSWCSRPSHLCMPPHEYPATGTNEGPQVAHTVGILLALAAEACAILLVTHRKQNEVDVRNGAEMFHFGIHG